MKIRKLKHERAQLHNWSNLKNYRSAPRSLQLNVPSAYHIHINWWGVHNLLAQPSIKRRNALELKKFYENLPHVFSFDNETEYSIAAQQLWGNRFQASRIATTKPISSHLISKWCEENCTGYWVVYASVFTFDNTFTIRMRSVTDAMLFKLMFGDYMLAK